ncbi:hypothetical protein Poly51_02990 [Rubripirellula tenax]|uniref:Uncharacterized protein n=1 Tax=Rubripirellula tenax TaxID=2528015 RepID=A0A5C6FGP4_9BACT|nr:hypothetical protein [Rubripirellula tenax]TWU60025.1 hypothetical protein Poly51_02990 [Rubripirellula tenax]
MSYDEPLVGGLSIALSMIATFIAVGPWDQPYDLRSIRAVRARYGKPVARGVWIAIAVAAFSSGVAILGGIRPSYAEQQVGNR